MSGEGNSKTQLASSVQGEWRYEALNNDASQGVIDLILPIQQKEFGVNVNLSDQPDLLDLEGCYWQTGGGFWGAIRQQEIIGTIGLIRFGAHGGAIRKMFVSKDWRGGAFGIASQLLDILIDNCKRTGITDLYLGTVEVLKGAHRFYEKNGFSRIAVEDLPADFPRMAVDTVFYHLHIL